MCFSLGLDAKVLAEIINSSTGRCWSSDLYNPVPGIRPNVPSSEDYEVLLDKEIILCSTHIFFYGI